MDNKSRKIYNKVLDYREKGEINKALELCESILAENLREAEILNFKVLMLYEKGMLKDAVTVWKINVDLNNNKKMFKKLSRLNFKKCLIINGFIYFT